MASPQAWSIKKQWASKFEEFLRTPNVNDFDIERFKNQTYFAVHELVEHFVVFLV